jgi:CheY-like chemotaxis protein
MKNLKKNNIETKRGTILILEDSFPIRNIVKFILEKNDYSVIEFSNGHTAIEYINEKEIPDLKLIISDVMMPEISGIEFVRILRKENKLPNIPIIFLTANADIEVVADAKALGVTGYLLKPITTTKLLDVLKKLFPNEKFRDVSFVS